MSPNLTCHCTLKPNFTLPIQYEVFFELEWGVNVLGLLAALPGTLPSRLSPCLSPQAHLSQLSTESAASPYPPTLTSFLFAAPFCSYFYTALHAVYCGSPGGRRSPPQPS